MASPPREKLIRPGEFHLFCAGDGCGARLAIRRLSAPVELHQSTNEEGGVTISFEEHPEQRQLAQVTLETRYTNKPNLLNPERCPEGSWWREKTGGYKGMERGRDVRNLFTKQARRHEEKQYDWMPPGQRKKWVDSVLSLKSEKTRRQRQEEIDRYTTGRRDRKRISLPPGTHTVVCYECHGKAQIRGSDASFDS